MLLQKLYYLISTLANGKLHLLQENLYQNCQILVNGFQIQDLKWIGKNLTVFYIT